jgi:site-specific recombinase XerD
VCEVTADQPRQAMRRACQAAGIAHCTPHGLRHRRVSLLHERGMSWARIGELVGHDAYTSATTYTHVIGDVTELDHAALLDR